MPASDIHRTGCSRWQVDLDWEDLLFDDRGLRLDAWRRCARVVKQGAHRTVYRVGQSGRTFYVKRYRRSRLGDVVGNLVRGSAARREWSRAHEIARRGIATVKPLAWAESIRGGLVRDSFFVCEAIEPSCSIDELLAGAVQGASVARARLRRGLIEALARFVAAMHEAGVDHNDFHAGNLLLGWQGPPGHGAGIDRSLQWFLLDVPDVRLGGPLAWPAVRRSLIMLNAGWWHRTSLTERRRFWRTYRDARPGLDLPPTRDVFEALDYGTWRYTRRLARRRDRRVWGTNRDFWALRDFCGRAHAVADFPEDQLVALLQSPDAILEQSHARTIKVDRSALVVRAELALSGGPVGVAYKQYRPRNRWKAFWGRFRRRRALRGWFFGNALVQRRIATARPLAALDFPSRRRSYLATEWIAEAENLHEYGWRLAGCGEADRFRRACRAARSVGRLIGSLHAWQLTHGDLKGANVLVVEQEDGLPSYLIDVEDVRIGRRCDPRAQAADLARLATSLAAHPWVSRTVVCRFFRAYAGQFPRRIAPWKWLWRKAAARSRRMIARKRRRGSEIL